MSQWNNTYAYNNQYQAPNVWPGGVNEQQITNHGYYPNPSNQYVSFNEFLSQMQNSNAVASNTAAYDLAQYQTDSTFPVSQQFNYQNMQSSSSNIPPSSYSYRPATSAEETYPAQTQYSALPEATSSSNEMAFKSTLTATATEFVPKSSIAITPRNAKLESSETSNIGVKETKPSHGSSSDKNWRERSQSSQQNGASRSNQTHKQNEQSRYESNTHSHKNYDSNSREFSTNSRNREHITRKNETNTNIENGSQYSEYSSRNQESSYRSYEPNRRYYDSNNRNYDSNNRNYDSNNRNDDSSGRNYDSSGRYLESSNQYSESGNRYSESSSRNFESNDRNNESSSRNYESSNRYNDTRGQSKPKSKTKDAERTFYNSGNNKGNQDIRSFKGEGSSRKNWVGSQRVKPVDRNMCEDEQYANTYLQYRGDKESTSKSDVASSPRRSTSKAALEQKGSKQMTQRERLSDQLDKGTLECLVCCERVRQTDPVWSCSNCYHVLHLRCIRKWALSSVVDCKWRCPACQNTSEEVPCEYRCMCGAVRSPDYLRGTGGAHTCGQACGRARACPHPCPLLCHPGPCPPCLASITKQCGCGAESRAVACSNKTPQICGGQCGRTLLCGVHACDKQCHEGLCDPCIETVTQVCYCMLSQSRTVPCTAESGRVAAWACGAACARVLPCGAHSCRRACHAPPCPPCHLLPAAQQTCPCGKARLEEGKRQKCTDPIPLCGAICAKPLPCGPLGDKHFCKLDCHEGDCPDCPDKTLLQCRCGHSSREVICTELPEMLNNVVCSKKCNKKLSCGRHKCRSVCCAALSHRCVVPCGRTLSCQLHRCEDFCHTGHCAPCPRVSFDELTCECGAEVLMPPVRCGAKPPACGAPCRRARACGHAPHHSCHSGECPPCVVLTTKPCHGRHEERKTIPCSQEEFSCGLPCGKPLPCGKHTCIKICHSGPCDTSKCTQPCNEKRPHCGHACAAPCHAGGGGACPGAAPCRRAVRATCQCGRRSAERACCEHARDLARIMSTLAATKMQEGGSVDLSDVQRPGAMLKTMECDDECRVEARTRQMALALQIRNPDVSAKLAPRYSDHLRSTAAKEPAFAQQTHDRLTELVQLAKKSKQKTRSHSFPSMNWQKRQFIHELCEHFGCESVAYDAEPNRNVVATADKEKSWLPAMSVLEVLAREAGKRRVPGPILRAPASQPSSSAVAGLNNSSKTPGGWATLTSTNAWAARSQAKQASQVPAHPSEKIDYFDNPPDN